MAAKYTKADLSVIERFLTQTVLPVLRDLRAEAPEEPAADESKPIAVESPNPGNVGEIVGYFQAPDGQIHAALAKESDADPGATRERIQANHPDWVWKGMSK